MLQIGKARFAESQKELMESLFDPNGSADGIAKRNKRSITLHRLDGEICGVVSSGGVIGKATRLPDGRVWYSYGDCELVGPLEYGEERDLIRSLCVGIDWDRRGEIRYRYK